MDPDSPLADAYERLLGEVSRRLGADHAELLLHGATGAAPSQVATYGAPPPDATWLDLPIREGAAEVGQLHMAFAPGRPVPGQSEHSLALALAELAALLIEEHRQHTWAPLRQAGRRILAVTEEELQRIILDIHDGPVQKLFVVSSRLSLLRSRLADGPRRPAPDARPGQPADRELAPRYPQRPEHLPAGRVPAPDAAGGA
jgi:signal transduction histidine kinase